MMVYRGYRGVKTASGGTFIPLMRSTGIFGSTREAMVAIDKEINSRCVASMTISAGPGAGDTRKRTVVTDLVGEKGPSRRAAGIVQIHPGRGEAVKSAPGAKEGKRRTHKVGKKVLDMTLVAAICFLIVFVLSVAAGIIQQ